MPKSLFAKINDVTVLDIATDRPIRAYRCLVNGKAERPSFLKGDCKHLYVAAVLSRDPVEVHMQIGNTACLISMPFKYYPDNPTQTGSEYMPPRREVILKDWTTIYSLAMHEGDSIVRSFELQIRADVDSRPAPVAGAAP